MAEDSRSDLLSVARARRGSAVVLQFVGEIDLASVETVREALTAALADATAPDPLVLDLTGVAFLASAGLAELQSVHERAAERQITLRIVATSRAVLRPLEVTGMAATLDILPDLAAALAPATGQAAERPAL